MCATTETTKMTDLLVKLYDLPDAGAPAEALNGEGITIRRAMAYEKHLAVNWVRQTFGRRWASECDVSFANRPISCYVATHRGEIVGFASFDSTALGFFGPTGVAEEYRGRGIGKALLLACLHGMRQKGYAYAIIGAAGPTAFYSSVLNVLEIPDSTPGVYGDMLLE
jgi:GNAT superfamily N-acetyltransferase